MEPYYTNEKGRSCCRNPESTCADCTLDEIYSVILGTINKNFFRAPTGKWRLDNWWRDGLLAESRVWMECISEYKGARYLFSALASRLDPAIYGGGADCQVLARRRIQNSDEAERRLNQKKSITVCLLSNHSPQAKWWRLGKTPRPNHRVFIGATWKESGRIRVIAVGAGVPESRYIIAII